jgi:DNA gyrase subunit B
MPESSSTSPPASVPGVPPPAGGSPLPAGGSASYGSESIQVLEGLEAIRKRPGMYVGGTGLNGLHQLVYECVDNSIDEAMAGFAKTVTVRIGVDGSCTVIDDGRGMPIDPMSHENPLIDGRPAVEVIMTEVHAGGKFDDNAYKVSGGLHGVGVKCVNALSEWTEVEVRKNGRVHGISFARGEVSRPLHEIGAAPEGVGNGTRISFMPDPEIFADPVFRHDTLEHRLRELAYLNPGVTIRFIDERVDSEGQRRDDIFCEPDGVAAYVVHLASVKHAVSPCVHFRALDEASGTSAEVAFQYTDATSESLLAFGNNIFNADGGTHLQGFKASLTRVIGAYARRNGLVKDQSLTGEDLREGMTAVIAVRLTNPQFNNQTKDRLLNPEIEAFVSAAVSEHLARWLEEHPADAKRICQKAILAAEAREAARKARELIRRKGEMDGGGMPHKLSDCSSNEVDKTELFIVEGDSAGGSAKGGRDHVTQAILPLRGKLLNVEKARLDKVLGFEEIRTLVQALQCGIGEDFDIAKLRYGRVIIMTDADVDGSHIRTLLLTFFFRQMTELIRQGKIHIAQPPLFMVSRGKQHQYVLSEKQMADTLAELALAHAALAVRDASGAVTHRIEGDELRRLLRSLHRLEELVTVSRRRGLVFTRLLEARASDPEGRSRLPSHHLVWAEGESLHWSESEAVAVAESKSLVLGDLDAAAAPDPRRRGQLRELHENRELERIFESLAKQQVAIEDYALVQEESVSGERLPTRYGWIVKGGKGRSRAKAASESDPREQGESGETSEPGGGVSGEEMVEVANIPSILRVLGELGRRGIEVKRFKGLGEMEAEQLWETTMDPQARTLMRVTWDAASEAETLFSTLMGENVERRRAYIEKHALEVRNLDI